MRRYITHSLLLTYAQNRGDHKEHRTRTRDVAFVPRFQVDDAIGGCFSISTWREEYSLRITPVVVTDLVADRRTLPCSAVPKKKGRRRMRRFKSRGEDGFEGAAIRTGALRTGGGDGLSVSCV